jgi:cation diffusion facilitator family transporter
MDHGHQHPLQAADIDVHDARYLEARKVTLVGSVIDLLLGVAKIIVGYMGSSQALIADGIHSLSDLATDGLVLIAVKHGSRAADEEHPYGHGRIETLATVILGGALVVVAIGIGWDAVHRLLNPDLLLHPGWMALVVATISIVSKEAIYHYTVNAADRLNSNLLRANAWHSRSDAISSVIVVIGVIGTMAGLAYLDSIAAMGVGLMVAKIGFDLSWQGVQELIDTAMDPEDVQKIRETILNISGVKALHMLRTRRMGNDGLVDVHILVNPKVSVSEGHYISDTVRQVVLDRVDAVTDIMVHIDPEDDEQEALSSGLPQRDEVLALLYKKWETLEEVRNIEDVTLHYLDGKIHVEVLLPLEKMGDITKAKEAASKMKALAEADDNIANVQIRFY